MARILVVEDDTSNARVASVILSKMGQHQVTVSENADEILGRCRRGEVDLVVMDVSLGHTVHAGRRIGGVELTKILKSDSHTANIPVVLFTAHAMGKDRERLLNACGADGYIPKPIQNQAFLDEVNRLLQSRIKV